MQILERLPCAQQVVTSHLLFRIILQYVTDFNPELDPVVRNAQYITNTNFIRIREIRVNSWTLN